MAFASFLFWDSAHLTFCRVSSRYVEPCVTENWGRLKVWHQCFTTLELLQMRDWILLKSFWNEKTTSVGRQLAPKLSQSHAEKRLAWWAPCGCIPVLWARLVMPSNDRGGLCQQLLRKWWKMGRLQWEIRRSTLEDTEIQTMWLGQMAGQTYWQMDQQRNKNEE